MIYGEVKRVLVQAGEVSPDEVVDAINILAAIELIPDIVRVIDEAEAQRQQIVMFEETLNTYTNAARRAKQNLNPGGVVSDDYSVKEFICQSVDVVNLLGTRVDELIKFNGAPASEQQQ
jgi:hypothetical protein